MERLVEVFLRLGGVPLCCGGATVCFALYSAQVSRGADVVWAAVSQIETNRNDDGYQGSNSPSKKQVILLKNYARELRQHAGACLTLSLISAATAREAFRDWQHYGSQSSFHDMAIELVQRQKPIPFFARGPVLATTIVSLAATHHLYGGWAFLQPKQPPPVYLNMDGR